MIVARAITFLLLVSGGLSARHGVLSWGHISVPCEHRANTKRPACFTSNDFPEVPSKATSGPVQWRAGPGLLFFCHLSPSDLLDTHGFSFLPFLEPIKTHS